MMRFPGSQNAIIPLPDVEVIADMEAARMDWLALQQAANEVQPSFLTPFQSWCWTRAWRAHFAGAEPLLLLARDENGRALALLPLQRERHMGLVRITWLSMPGLQYGGLLMLPLPEQQRRAVFEALWAALMRQQADYIDLPLLAADDPFAVFLVRHCVAGPENASFRIDFTAYEDWRAFELALTPSARRSRKKRLNKLKRAGELTFAVRAPGAALAPVLRRALEWKRGWLAAQGLSGALPFDTAFEGLLHDLFATDTADDPAMHWRVAVLALDGQPIAVDAGKVCGDAYYSWFSAYDADHAAHSPGKIALWLMMQWCTEQGLSAYDMLANPAPYKEEWANQRRELAHFIKPLSVGGRAYALWMRHVHTMARDMYDALPPGVKAAVRAPLMHLRGGK